MFRWYEESQVCYAYLSDVRNASEDPSQRDSDFSTSKWFTRGWTLQELLAPHCKQYVQTLFSFLAVCSIYGEEIHSSALKDSVC